MKKQYTRLILMLVILGAAAFTQAQEFTLRGSIIDGSNKMPLGGANAVAILNSDASTQKGDISNKYGGFSISLKPGKYTLQISFVGYKTCEQAVEILDRNVSLGRLSLNPSRQDLDEVTVTGKVPLAKQLGDTISYNADAYKTNPDANAENLIEKMPGVSVQNGQVQAQGEAVQKVLVDGKPFFGNDPKAALQNIPAEMVKKVEIFDQQSEQAQFTGIEDGETTKTVNIVTRKEYRNGTFGNAAAGYGTDERYLASASVNVFRDKRRISLLGLSNNVNQLNFSSEDLVGVASSGGRRGRGRRSSGGGKVNDFTVNSSGGITTTNAIGLNYTDKWSDQVEITASYFMNRGDNTGENLLNQHLFN